VNTDELIAWIQEKIDSIQAWWSDNNFDPTDDNSFGSPEADEMWHGGSAQQHLLKNLAERLGVTDKIRWIKMP
jgi:hypothetical protein